MIGIVDNDLGNIGSILNMFPRLGRRDAVVAVKREEILAADALILPGVGHFDRAMRNLESRGLRAPLDEAVLDNKTPFLGICLGMQVLAESSAEGSEPGLGWIKGRVERLRHDAVRGTKVPHMSWAEVDVTRPDPVFEGIADPRFYFTHSFHFVPRDQAVVRATAMHSDAFVAAVRQDNIVAVQFHPEKSHRFGLRLLENFVRQVPE